MKLVRSSAIVLAAVALLWASVASAQTGVSTRGRPGGAPAAQTPSAGVTKVTPGMTLEQVLAKPDSEILEGPDGKRITVGELRRLRAVVAELEAQRQVAETERSQALSIRKPSGAQEGAAGVALSASSPEVAGPVAATCLTPEIRTVNGKVGGVTFTPEVPYNLYTIRGCDFGNATGSAFLWGYFTNWKGPFWFNVFPKSGISLKINFWRDDMIIAELRDIDISNNYDKVDVDKQDDVDLYVVRKDGKMIILKGHFKFAR